MAKYVAGIRERKKQQTKDALALAAVRITMEEGLESATIANIAAKADVSSRTFHNYFPHRDAALRHFFEQFIGRLSEAILAMPRGMHPVDVLRELAVQQLSETQDVGNRYTQLDTLVLSMHNSPHVDLVGDSYKDLQKLAAALSEYSENNLSVIDSYLLIHAAMGATRGVELALINSKSTSSEEELNLLHRSFNAMKQGFSYSI